MLGVALGLGSLLIVACSSGSGSDEGGQVDAEALGILTDDWVATSDQDKAVRAVLVQVHGEPAVERYYGGAREGEHWDVQSVTKSVLSLLVGIALDEGLLQGLDSTVAELLPERTEHMSAAMQSVTLEQLLTMTAGTEPDPQMHEKVILPRGSWVNHALGAPLKDQGSFAYSSVASHLIAASLEHANGGSILEYARTKLFDPLDIDTRPADERIIDRDGFIASPSPRFGWRTDAEGIHAGPGGLVLSAPDLLKIGELVLARGRWDGQQLVPEQWIEASTRVQVAAPPNQYGHHWWVLEAAGEEAFAAVGFGGQLIHVVPALDLVTVVVCAIPFPPSIGPATVVAFAGQLIASEVAAAG